MWTLTNERSLCCPMAAMNKYVKVSFDIPYGYLVMASIRIMRKKILSMGVTLNLRKGEQSVFVHDTTY